ncbi:MAG: glycosyl transferase family 4 [Candidatus Diapherotrites archaeon]|nr:glycosyl transferase family 4 [Candidatus Diapherotrites archaeon]
MNKKNFYLIYFLFLLFCISIAYSFNGLFFASIFVSGIAVTVWMTQRIFPFFIKRMEFRGITGKDMNKLNETKIAEMGGIIVLFGFITAIMLSVFLFTYSNLTPTKIDLHILLAAVLTITLVGLIGIFDDLIGWRKGIRQWQHALLPLLAALPLMAVRAGITSLNIPFFGVIELGVIYSLILIPIGITGASNAFNMLAGLNGLEAGQGIIILITMGLIAFFEGEIEAVLIAIALIGALLAFIRFNWVPAKVFGGDSLTLMVGAGIASIAIIGNMEKFGIALLALYFIELGFKAKHKFQSNCFGIPQKDGTLKADSAGGSLTQFIMKQGKFTEKQVVLIILGIQSVICLIGLILYFSGNVYL